MAQKIKQWFAVSKTSITLTVMIVLVYLLMFSIGITCPFKALFGISCPGCGISRACFHALQLDFAGAFAYHPLFWLVPIGFLAFLFERSSRVCRFVFYACLAAALIVYGFRIFDPNDTVVVFAPQESIIYKLIYATLTRLGV